MIFFSFMIFVPLGMYSLAGVRVFFFADTPFFVVRFFEDFFFEDFLGVATSVVTLDVVSSTATGVLDAFFLDIVDPFTS